MKNEHLKKWLALSLWDEIGPVKLNKIRTSLSEPWKVMDDPSLLEVIFTEKQRPQSPPVDELLEKADDLIKLQDQGRFQILSIFDTRYPGLLRNIHTPPPILYCIGDINLLKNLGIAVVGTRKPTGYGVEQTRKLTTGLAKANFVIISGMALGIDAVAHQSALDAGGYTVAVLGCGLDNPYPKTNKRIREQVEERGCVVTEFPWGTPPNPSQFPRRNRIISGLSRGVLITECTTKSGALVTVKHAVDQNRDVFSLPGPVTSPNSHGPISVIQQGGIPVIDVNDILINYQTTAMLPFPAPAKVEKQLDIDPELRPIWDLLDATPVSVDDLISTLRWSVAEIQSALLKMELLGLVKQVPGNRFIRAVSPVNPAE